MNIYVFKNDQQYGPYTADQLREFIQQGSFTLEDYACGDGQNWVPISQIPGFAAGQAQAGQPFQAQSAAGTTGGSATKMKVMVILFTVLGVAGVAALVALLASFLGDDEPSETPPVASVETEQGQGAEDDKNEEEEADDTDPVDTPEPSTGSTPPSTAPAPKLSGVSLPQRLGPDSLAVARIDYGKILEKGGEQLTAMIPLEGSEREREIFEKILGDPSTVGLDPSEPVQVALMSHPTDKASDKLTFSVAAKLSDSGKLKGLLALLGGEKVPEPEKRDGYDLFVEPRAGFCLAIAEDFFVVVGNDDKEVYDTLVAEAERFVLADGSGSLVEANKPFQAFAGQSHDAAIWVNGSSLDQVPGSEEIPEEFGGLIDSGTGVVTLDFNDGEAVLTGKLQVLEGFERFGAGGLSQSAIEWIPAKALAVLSLSLDMKAVEKYVEEVLLPASGEEFDLDEPIPNLGIKPRDVLQAFRGEVSFALTEYSPSPGGADPQGSESTGGDERVEQDPFGGGGPPPAEVDPFGGNPGTQPVPGQAFPGGPGGSPPGGPGAAGLPVEFIAALSVDPAKWETLKAAPPLAMAMGIAMLQGISVTVKDERLILASKKHAADAMEGSLKEKASGSEQGLFKENDFALKLDVAEAAKLEDVPLPPPVMANVKAFSYLAVTGKSDEKGGEGALRIGFSKKDANSLQSLLELAPMLQMMMGGPARPGQPDF